MLLLQCQACTLHRLNQWKDTKIKIGTETEPYSTITIKGVSVEGCGGIEGNGGIGSGGEEDAGVNLHMVPILPNRQRTRKRG